MFTTTTKVINESDARGSRYAASSSAERRSGGGGGVSGISDKLVVVEKNTRTLKNSNYEE